MKAKNGLFSVVKTMNLSVYNQKS